MSGFGSSILIETAPPTVLACLIRNAGWLYSGLVAATSRTADAAGRAPSFEIIDAVGTLYLLWSLALDSILRCYQLSVCNPVHSQKNSFPGPFTGLVASAPKFNFGS